MSQFEARQWLYDQLVALDMSGVNVYKYALENVAAPCVMIADSDPVLQIATVGNSTADMALRLVCLVPQLDTEAAVSGLELITDLLLLGLPKEKLQFSIVGATSTMTIGVSDYYSRDIPVTMRIEL